MRVEDVSLEMARRAGFLESIVVWALHPERTRDADYRLDELRERWADYLARFEDAAAGDPSSGDG